MKPEDERMFGMLCHLLGFAGLLGVPLGSIIGPLVIWLIKKDESEFVDQCGKNALNFQISMTIYLAVSAVLTLIFIGFVLLLVLGIVWLIGVIQASIAANEGRQHVYPLTITFLH